MTVNYWVNFIVEITKKDRDLSRETEKLDSNPHCSFSDDVR